MASENISFDNIPTSIRKPGIYTENNTSQAVQSLPTNAVKVALLAQKTSSGVGTSDVPVRCFSESDLILDAGTGSIGHLSGRAMLTANPNIILDLVPIADAVGTAAEGTVVVSGVNSTNAGSVVLWVGNERVEASVAVGDDADAVADSLNTAIIAREHVMPITSSVSTDTITFVARNDGELGNNIPVSSSQSSVLGDTTLAITQPTGGATDPSIANALTGIYPGNYNLICNTLNNSTALGLLKTHLDSVEAPTENRPAIGTIGYTGVQATCETLCGTTLNSERLTCGFIPYDATSERGHSLDYEVGAAYTGVIASEEDPARPLNTLILRGIAPSNLEKRLSRSQQESLLLNGVTPLEVQPGEEVGIVRAITTYATSSTGYADVSLLDVTTMRTLDFVRLSLETRLSSVFPRAKLSERTPKKVRTQIIDVLFKLEKLEIVEKVAENLDKIIVERDSVDANRINAAVPCDVVNGLHVLGIRIDLYL